MRYFLASCCLAHLAGCAGGHATQSPNDVRMILDKPVTPSVVHFEVPTALIMGLPGQRVPVALEARVSSREIAARELATHGYCPRGFLGPDEITFPEGDRSRSRFMVRCVE